MDKKSELLLTIVRQLWPVVDELKINDNGKVEFGIISYENEINWFPICQSPYVVWERVKEFMKESHENKT